MKKYVIKLNGKVYEVEMEEVTGGTTSNTFAEAPKAAPVNSAPQNVAEKTTAPVNVVPPTGGETMQAPMPGNILDIPVKVGDQVKKGQVVIILEAMKMENEIVSPVNGTVLSISVSKGQTVNAGDVLIQIG